MNKIKTLAIFTIIIFFFNLNKVYASDVFIEFKIENEVITNIDINKEKNYLIALNNNLKNISKKQLYEISKKSVINETIKKKEILNYFDLEKAELVMDVIIADFYKQLGFKNKEEFKNYLQNYQVSINNRDNVNNSHYKLSSKFVQCHVCKVDYVRWQND